MGDDNMGVDEGEETMTRARRDEMTSQEIAAKINDAGKCTDGWYAIYADGSTWVAVLLRRGKMVGLTEESLCSTHTAAADRRSPICLAIANSDTSPVSEAVANAVVAAYDGELNPYMCVVERIGS